MSKIENRSVFGEWESQGERADSAAWTVANIHHIHSRPREGYACLCGEKTVTARRSTEHILEMGMRALGQQGIPLQAADEQEPIVVKPHVVPGNHEDWCHVNGCDAAPHCTCGAADEQEAEQ